MAGTYSVPVNTKNVLVGSYMVKNIQDMFFKGNPYLYRLQGKTEPFTGGRDIIVPMIWKQEGGGGQWFKGADILDTTIRDPLDQMVFHPKSAVVPVSWTWEDDLDVSGPTMLKSLVKTKGDIARETAKNLIGTDIFNTGNNAMAMMGLAFSLKAFTGGAPGTLPSQSYGGKTRSGVYAQTGSTNNWLVHYGDNTSYDDASNWDPYASGNLGVLKPLNKAWMRIYYQSGKFPTLLLSNIGAFACYHNALTVNDRYQRPQQSSRMAESGYESLKFHMADWVVDPACTRNDTTSIESIYFLNEKTVKLFVHSEANFKFFPYREAHNQLASVAYIVWRGELIVVEPRANGVLSNVKVALSA